MTTHPRKDHPVTIKEAERKRDELAARQGGDWSKRMAEIRKLQRECPHDWVQGQEHEHGRSYHFCRICEKDHP